MGEIRILSADDVRRALPMADAIAGMKQAFSQLSSGAARVPLRGRLSVPPDDGVTLLMPAYMEESVDLAVKIVSVFPANVRRGEPLIYASVLMLDPTSGRLLALLEGNALTAIRTGAGGGAATDLLARPDARVVGLLGSGVQARTGLEAVCTVRSIELVRVYSPHRARAEALATELGGRGPIPAAIEVVDSAAEAVREADIIYTATTSTTPTFPAEAVRDGTHIVGVGSFTPAMREVDPEVVRRALIVVDSFEAALEEAGELIAALEAGSIDRDHLYAELGEIVNGSKQGRTSPEQVTFFKSVGVAVQDAVAARIAYENAVRDNIGRITPF